MCILLSLSNRKRFNSDDFRSDNPSSRISPVTSNCNRGDSTYFQLSIDGSIEISICSWSGDVFRVTVIVWT